LLHNRREQANACDVASFIFNDESAVFYNRALGPGFKTAGYRVSDNI
jgi:hypothetical protein